MAVQRKNTNRIKKLNAVIQQEVGRIIMPFLEGQEGLVTVSRAETSKDTKWAKIYISIVGGNDEAVLKTIEKNLYDIQGDLNRTLNLKLVPRLQFFLDTSPRYAQHIDELLDTIHNEEHESGS